MTPLRAPRSPAKSQPRCTRGRMSCRICRRAWVRSRTSSLVVRTTPRMKPSGRIRKRLNRRRPSRSPRRAPTRLIVANVVGASPLNRLLTDTPPSASSPRPSECSASMSTASAGLFATKTRPVARSTQRKAGMPSVVPCRIPIWLAGVVAGSVGVHSMNSWLPLADPPRQGRQGAAHDAPLQHREGHAVELHEQDAGHLRVRDRLPPSRAAHEVGEDGVVGARRHHPRGQGGDAGDDPGRPEGGEERVDRHPRHHARGRSRPRSPARAGPAPGRRTIPSGVARATSTGRITSPTTAMTSGHQHDRPHAVEGDAGQDPAGQPETDAARQQGHERPPDVRPVEPGKHRTCP